MLGFWIDYSRAYKTVLFHLGSAFVFSCFLLRPQLEYDQLYSDVHGFARRLSFLEEDMRLFCRVWRLGLCDLGAIVTQTTC